MNIQCIFQFKILLLVAPLVIAKAIPERRWEAIFGHRRLPLDDDNDIVPLFEVRQPKVIRLYEDFTRSLRPTYHLIKSYDAPQSQNFYVPHLYINPYPYPHPSDVFGDEEYVPYGYNYHQTPDRYFTTVSVTYKARVVPVVDSDVFPKKSDDDSTETKNDSEEVKPKKKNTVKKEAKNDETADSNGESTAAQGNNNKKATSTTSSAKPEEVTKPEVKKTAEAGKKAEPKVKADPASNTVEEKKSPDDKVKGADTAKATTVSDVTTPTPEGDTTAKPAADATADVLTE